MKKKKTHALMTSHVNANNTNVNRNVSNVLKDIYFFLFH